MNLANEVLNKLDEHAADQFEILFTNENDYNSFISDYLDSGGIMSQGYDAPSQTWRVIADASYVGDMRKFTAEIERTYHGVLA